MKYSPFLFPYSLYSPIESKGEFIPGKIETYVPDTAERERKRQSMLEKLEKILSPQKIDEYVRRCLNGREQMLASETIVPKQAGHSGNEKYAEDAFVKAIYIRLYGQRKSMGYEVVPKGWVTVNGYRFRDFIIRIK